MGNLPDVIELAGNRYNGKWLRTVTEEVAIRSLPKNKRSQVTNAWKQANGKSVRNQSSKKKKTDKK